MRGAPKNAPKSRIWGDFQQEKSDVLKCKRFLCHSGFLLVPVARIELPTLRDSAINARVSSVQITHREGGLAEIHYHMWQRGCIAVLG